MKKLLLRQGEQGVANLHRKEFDLLKSSQHLSVGPIELSQLNEAADFAAHHLPEIDLGDLALIRSIVEIDPAQVQLFHRFGRLVGLFAILFLNPNGKKALLDGSFDGSRPDLDFLVTRKETPSAIYSWLVICPGRAAAGIGNVSVFLNTPRFQRADLFARPATVGGLRILRGTGHRPVTSDPNGLHRYVRLANRHTVQEKAA